MGVMVRPAPGVLPFQALLCSSGVTWIKLDSGQRDAGESGAAVCVWVQLCSHLLSSSGARNDSRGKQTGEGGIEREGGYVCVRGEGRRKTGNEDQHRAWNGGKEPVSGGVWQPF